MEHETAPDVTVGQYLQDLYNGADLRRCLSWPPDAFALAGSLLKDSGAYMMVAESAAWPPQGLSRKQWCTQARRVGKDWRASTFPEAGKAAPREVADQWEVIDRLRDTPLAQVWQTTDLWVALVALAAFADEACAGVGVPPMRRSDGSPRAKDPFELAVAEQLLKQFDNKLPATLCRAVARSRVSVLPKTHTPLNGVTMRSMTHNLALIQGCSVRTQWIELGEIPARSRSAIADSMNVLVIPWPFEVRCRDFSPIHDEKIAKLPPNHRFFHYTPPDDLGTVVNVVQTLLKKAREQCGRIDAVILPELAVTPPIYESLRTVVVESGGDASFLICGVAESGEGEEHGQNRVEVCFTAGEYFYEVSQFKHHRWYLEDSQIRRYGLASVLDPGKVWWESASLRHRELSFFSVEPWLTMSVLICEDLARPDPVGDIVRAVGPNLVVALLMDGPQIAGRWSERSAAVLADDPGSAVLTLTSLGMATASRSPDGGPPLRVIGLWKSRSGLRKIELPSDKRAAVLSLSSQFSEEWTADGRGDRSHAAEIHLAGVAFVGLD